MRYDKNNWLQILIFFPVISVLIPINAMAEQKLQLLYSNDVRSELEACG